MIRRRESPSRVVAPPRVVTFTRGPVLTQLMKEFLQLNKDGRFQCPFPEARGSDGSDCWQKLYLHFSSFPSYDRGMLKRCFSGGK